MLSFSTALRSQLTIQLPPQPGSSGRARQGLRDPVKAKVTLQMQGGVLSEGLSVGSVFTGLMDLPGSPSQRVPETQELLSNL
ncbi:hypothetical protein SKAU_G00216650 [Synaphobranchus kaupii]|uniref:Uncharacterized protein n=1 Tax=Synaphobranchus kaupii TaxID=118154 RepID=A0A9Q1F9Z4_SYNKA|nr:hypothetical protein SKAU_G00216650 [Synaphobranchus kaupii]